MQAANSAQGVAHALSLPRLIGVPVDPGRRCKSPAADPASSAPGRPCGNACAAPRGSGWVEPIRFLGRFAAPGVGRLAADRPRPDNIGRLRSPPAQIRASVRTRRSALRAATKYRIFWAT